MLTRFFVHRASNSHFGHVRMATRSTKGCLELSINTSRSVFVEHTLRRSSLGVFLQRPLIIRDGVRDSRGSLFFGAACCFFSTFFFGVFFWRPGSPKTTAVFVKNLSAQHSRVGYWTHPAPPWLAPLRKRRAYCRSVHFSLAFLATILRWY